MALVTRTPVPPFRAVELCLGHAFNYATAWFLLDSEGRYPYYLVEERGEHGPDKLHDKEWCERMAEELNQCAVS